MLLEAGIRRVVESGDRLGASPSKLRKNKSSLRVWGVTIGGKFIGFAAGAIAQPMIATVTTVALVVITAGTYVGLQSARPPIAPPIRVQDKVPPPQTAFNLKNLLRKPIVGADAHLTSGFGMNRHPILQVSKMHTGTDWSAPLGTPVVAAADGVIEEVGMRGEYGNYVRVRHSIDVRTAYGHLSHFAEGLSVGITVGQRQIIGYIGSTGLAVGPHLHYEVIVNDKFINPLTVGNDPVGDTPSPN
jgi:murein DD-endopeptidase MepM/ murein hydrolase activator NlpD